MRRTLAIAVGLLAACSCGGSGGGTILLPPANVAGVWNFLETNAAQAILTGCTGVLMSLEGTSIEDLRTAVICDPVSPQTVTQSGSSFSVVPKSFTCSDLSSGTYGGGGTVNGNDLSGQLDTVSSLGTLSGLFTGTVAGTDLTLNTNRLQFSGTLPGSCNVVPSLVSTGTIM